MAVVQAFTWSPLGLTSDAPGGGKVVAALRRSQSVLVNGPVLGRCRRETGQGASGPQGLTGATGPQ